MALSDVNNRFYEIVDQNWSGVERQNLYLRCENAMVSDSYSGGYQQLDQMYGQGPIWDCTRETWDYPSPPMWSDDDMPFYLDDDEAM